jgi:hypothetical protein
MILGLLIDVLRRHFADTLNIESPDLRSLVWRKDERTGILIESIYRWRGELVEKRPAVVVKPNARANVKMGIGNVLGPDEQGHVKYQTFWVGSHTLFCIHGLGASVDILATEVQREITQFAPVLGKYLDLYEFQVTEVGAVAEVEEARESFVIPVTVGWAYGETWKVEYESLKLMRVPLSVLLQDALL